MFLAATPLQGVTLLRAMCVSKGYQYAAQGHTHELCYKDLASTKVMGKRKSSSHLIAKTITFLNKKEVPIKLIFGNCAALKD
jgi:hypothetical protein